MWIVALVSWLSFRLAVCVRKEGVVGRLRVSVQRPFLFFSSCCEFLVSELVGVVFVEGFRRTGPLNVMGKACLEFRLVHALNLQFDY